MFPLPRDLERQLRKMGLRVEELKGVKLVLIETNDREILIESPQVYMMILKDQRIFQIVGSSVKEIKEGEKAGDVEERVKRGEEAISDEDIRFVMEQTGTGYEEARDLLRRAGGDIAKAIMMFNEERSRR